MSSAGTTAEQPGGKGTKRGPEEAKEKQETEPADGDQTGPPPTKTAKPNPSPAVDMGGVAVAVKAEGAAPTDSERVEAEALSSLGLAVGTRLEVMWLLEDDDKSVEKVSDTQQAAVVVFPRLNDRSPPAGTHTANGPKGLVTQVRCLDTACNSRGAPSLT